MTVILIIVLMLIGSALPAEESGPFSQERHVLEQRLQHPEAKIRAAAIERLSLMRGRQARLAMAAESLWIVRLRADWCGQVNWGLETWQAL